MNKDQMISQISAYFHGLKEDGSQTNESRVAAEVAWSKFVREYLSHIIIIDPYDLESFSDRAVSVRLAEGTFHASVAGLYESMKLTKMLEERTLEDYLSRISARVQELGSTVLEDRSYCERASQVLSELKSGEPMTLEANITTVQGAIETYLELLKVVENKVCGEQARRNLTDKLSPVWRHVNREWGGWSLRLRKPIRYALVVFLLSVGLYSLIASFAPFAELATLLTTLCPIFALVIVYGRAKSRLEETVVDALGEYKWLKQRGSDIWSDEPKIVYGSLRPVWPRRVSKSSLVVDDSEFTGSTKKMLGAGVAGLAVYVVLIVVTSHLAPKHTILLSSDGSICTYGGGVVRWAGFGAYVIQEGARVSVMERNSPFVGLAPMTTASGVAACSEPPGPSVESGQIVLSSTIQMDEKFYDVSRRGFWVSYPNDVVNCDASDFGDGDQPSQAGREALSRLGRALIQCSSEKNPVVVDVRGYSSSRQFSCTAGQESDALNLALAEKRRSNAICELFDCSKGSFQQKGGRFVVPESNVELTHAYGRRWSGIDQMRQSLIFDDSKGGDKPLRELELLTRAVEVEIVDGGDCAKLNG